MESAFQKARREAKEEALKDYNEAKEAGMQRIGKAVGRAQASLTESPKSRILRAFAPEKKQKKKGGKMKAFLKGMKKAGQNFAKNTSGGAPAVGGVLGAELQAAKGGKSLEPKAPKRKKTVTTYYE